MKHTRNILLLFICNLLAGCITEHEVDLVLAPSAPENLLYHQNDIALAFNKSAEIKAPELLAEGEVTFGLENVYLLTEEEKETVANEANPFAIAQTTGSISLTPNEFVTTGNYVLDISVTNEVGTTLFDSALRVILIDKRPRLALDKSSDNILISLDGSSLPVTTKIENIKALAEEVSLSNIQLDVTPALPANSSISIDENGNFNINGILENLDYTITLSAENDFGMAQDLPSFVLQTEVIAMEERELFTMNLTEGYKPSNLDEFEFADMFFKKVSGPTLATDQTWWNISKEVNNHPNQERNQRYITRMYARKISGASKADHILTPIASFSTEGLQAIVLETGVVFNQLVSTDPSQRIEIRVVGENAYQNAITNNTLADEIDNWQMIYSTAEHSRTATGWEFIYNVAEGAVSMAESNLKVVVIFRHGLESADNKGYMGLDELNIKGRYLVNSQPE